MFALVMFVHLLTGCVPPEGLPVGGGWYFEEEENQYPKCTRWEENQNFYSEAEIVDFVFETPTVPPRIEVEYTVVGPSRVEAFDVEFQVNRPDNGNVVFVFDDERRRVFKAGCPVEEDIDPDWEPYGVD